MEYLLMLLLCEPSVVFYPVFDPPPGQASSSAPWGVGFRARMTDGTWEHGVRIRFDITSQSRDDGSGTSRPNDYFFVSADYLHHGGGWGSRWYYGVGVGWLARSYNVVVDGDGGASVTNVVSGNTPTGSLVFGRAVDLGPGQFMVEGRVDAASLDGRVRPIVAVSAGYRHHFKVR